MDRDIIIKATTLSLCNNVNQSILMDVRLTRIDKSHVRLECEHEGKVATFHSVPHTLGQIEQANLFIVEQAMKWKARGIACYVDDPEELNNAMWRQARSVYGYEVTALLHYERH